MPYSYLPVFRTSLISTYADRQTDAESIMQTKRNCISVVRTANRLMADRCYLGIAMRKSVRRSFNILDKPRTPYKPVTNKEALNKGLIHNRVPNVVREKINCL
jgi:hypothetical protein